MADVYDRILWKEAEEWRHSHEMEAYLDEEELDYEESDEPLRDLIGEVLDEDDLEVYHKTGIF